MSVKTKQYYGQTPIKRKALIDYMEKKNICFKKKKR